MSRAQLSARTARSRPRRSTTPSALSVPRIEPRRANLWLAAGVLALLPLAAQAQLGVSPSRFELQLTESPSTESVRVFNFSEKEVELVVEVLNWDLDEANTVRELPPEEQSLDQWIVVNPVHFTVPAKESRTVRFSIRPKVRPETGEHRALIYFRQLPPPPDDNPSFNVLYRVGLAVYAQAGELDRRAILHEVAVTDGLVQFDVDCPGNAHVRFDGQYAVWPADGFPGSDATTLIANVGKAEASVPESVLEAGELPGTPVLPGTRRTLSLELQQALPPGAYVLDLNGTLGAEPLDRAVSFTVRPQPDQGEG